MESVIKAPGIMCNGCANTIVTNLSAIDGVEQVDVDVEQKLINLKHANDILPEIREKLSEIGYPAED